MPELPNKPTKSKALPVIGSMLITSTTLSGEQSTFSLIPLTTDCPYVECVFDPKRKILACLLKEKKNHFSFMPKVDDKGMMTPNTDSRTKVSHPFKQERKMFEVFHEIQIEKAEDIITFVEMFAINADRADYKSFL
jgi:hypothetical protein